MHKRRRSAIGLVYLRSPGGSAVMFRYYLLEGDTAAPSGLYPRLAMHFLVTSILYYGIVTGHRVMAVGLSLCLFAVLKFG